MSGVEEQLELKALAASRPSIDPNVELVAVRSAERPIADAETLRPPTQLDSRATWSLLAQHLSSTWGQRCYEFAS